jgi:hypothetical protein
LAAAAFPTLEFVVMTSREAEHRQRQREESERQREASQRSPFPRVIPWLEWVKLRGISASTAERLKRTGRVKITQLSPRRIGVREDHDREYLDSCVRGPS